MQQIIDLLPQMTPWGLTVGQTAMIFVVMLILLIGWVFVRVGLRLTGMIFRLGCAAILVFSCGIVMILLFYNLTSNAK